MKNQDLIEKNELNKNSNGGTEITTRELYDLLDRNLLDKVQIVTARVRELNNDKIKIYHLHDLPLDPEAQHLRSKESRDRFDKLVFSSHWQYQQYRDYLGIPYDSHSTVILTGFHPIPMIEKPKDKIRLIYTSTPHRGLEILVPVFEEIAKTRQDIELHVYSSFGIYGWEERDKIYEPLFERCRRHPQIMYHGWQHQDVVRKAYQEAHILAYPCIWQETSCRTLIEAMSAGCHAVHPNFSALPETSCAVTRMFDGDLSDINRHAQNFYAALLYTINTIHNPDNEAMLAFNKILIDSKHGWHNISERWRIIIENLIREKEGKNDR